MADYLFGYTPDVNDNLDDMLAELERIGNLTRGAEEKVVFMRDSATLAQKSSQPGKNLMMSEAWLYLGNGF